MKTVGFMRTSTLSCPSNRHIYTKIVTPQSQYRRGFWGIGDDGDDLSFLFR